MFNSIKQLDTWNERGDHMNNEEILLESGTNELEVIVFRVGDSLFGINVLKVREIIHTMPVTHVPNSHKNVEGIINLRDEVIPVVDLAGVLNLEQSTTPENDKFIIAEFNQIKIAFHIHDILKIYRLSWKDIEKPDQLSAAEQSYAVGYSTIDDKMVILADFEKVIVEINPKLGVSTAVMKALENRDRSEKQLLIAEDSAVLRQLLYDTLVAAGYERLKVFTNGEEAWEYLKNLSEEEKEASIEHLQLIITDIEMPQMDGHHLTDRIKKDPHLKDIPVIIFSSLITDDLYHRGVAVGASAQVSKPQMEDLVETIDSYIL